MAKPLITAAPERVIGKLIGRICRMAAATLANYSTG
jgi:hypothetical protein